MKTKLLLVAAFAVVAGGVVHAADSAKPASRVEVIFVQPEKFTDLKDEYMDSGRAREHYMAEIQGQVEQLARRYVAEGQHLEVKFIDVDLAGDFEPWHGLDFDHVRIMREIYPPRMEIEFRLTDAGGKVISEGKRKLRSLGYLMTTVSPTWDPLRYDKDLLREWMGREFKRAS
jgi:hypothetical protein